MAELLACLQSISAHAKDMMALARSRGATGSRPTPTTLPHFDELLPPNLDFVRTRLQEARLPPKAIKGTLSAYESACARWKHDLEEAFDRTAHSISPHNFQRLAQLRTRLYVEQVQKWLYEVLQVPERWKAEMEKQRAHINATMGPDKTTGPGKRSRPKFHSEYTPVLELYFHFNAYPTYADRRILAEKTGMLTRQITVWFQNHRRRAKGPLPRMSPTAKIPMEEFERQLENLARKIVPVLLPPTLRRFAPGNENKSLAAASRQSAGKSSKNAKRLSELEKAQQVPRKPSENAEAGPSSLGAMLARVMHNDSVSKKKSKKAKKEKASQQNVVCDVEMRDATATKEKRRKMKKLPRAAGQPFDVPMDVERADKASRKAMKKAKKSPRAFDSRAELAFAQAAYPSPSQYAYVHSRKPSAQKPSSDSPRKDFGQLGKGRPSSNSTSSTVPPHRVSSRLNAMRPPYAFPAPYNAAAVPLTFSVASSTQFAFATDNRSFGFAERTPRKATVPAACTLIDYLISKFAGLRLLCVEQSVSSRSISLSTSESGKLAGLRTEGLTTGEASGVQTHVDSYAARRAITYVPPSAPLDCVVHNLARALQLKQVRPMVLAQPVVQPDAFAPFIARAERRARRKERKQRKALEEKQAKKDRKERQKASRSQRDSPSMDADVQSRASSVASTSSLPARKSSKKSRKSKGESAASSRATSVASSVRTPSLSSTSSRRSSGMSMPGTPRPEQDLPIMATADFNFAGDEDVTMTPDLAAQLFGEDEDGAAALGQMQYEEFSPDMLTFTSTAGGALSDMTADVNMPDLGNAYTSQQSVDDMNWTGFGLDAQNSASPGLFGDESNTGLDWLLSHNLLGDTQMSDLSYTAPTSTPSQINILGSTYACELGGSDSLGTPFNMNDWTFGLGACDDGFAGFGNNLLGGTAVAV
uniref:Mating-type protein A-alpha Y4 n=1 Tax=Schizophyllum commune TaxID=5334 RepID=MAAY4_SCHCO|nr:RecName: Full=Mating-type protein A-alpha Y4 [Schizophyllum commune]AAB01373.1 A-alpha-Y4 protein [Schizophyllum commune]